MDATTPPYDLGVVSMTLARYELPRELQDAAELSIAGEQQNQRDKGFHQLLDAAIQRPHLWPSVASWLQGQLLGNKDNLRPGVLRRFLHACPLREHQGWAQERLEEFKRVTCGATHAHTSRTSVPHSGAAATSPEEGEYTGPGFGNDTPHFFLIPFRRERKS